MLVRQALYHWSHWITTLPLFSFSYFSDNVSCFLHRLALDCNPSTYTSQVAGIMYVHHYTPLILLNKISVTLFLGWFPISILLSPPPREVGRIYFYFWGTSVLFFIIHNHINLPSHQECTRVPLFSMSSPVFVLISLLLIISILRWDDISLNFWLANNIKLFFLCLLVTCIFSFETKKSSFKLQSKSYYVLGSQFLLNLSWIEQKWINKRYHRAVLLMAHVLLDKMHTPF
jgi:hypothetical protein